MSFGLAKTDSYGVDLDKSLNEKNQLKFTIESGAITLQTYDQFSYKECT